MTTMTTVNRAGGPLSVLAGRSSGEWAVNHGVLRGESLILSDTLLLMPKNMNPNKGWQRGYRPPAPPFRAFGQGIHEHFENC